MKGRWKIVLGLLFLVIMGVAYYVTLPAVNIHSQGFYGFLLAGIMVFFAIYLFMKSKKYVKTYGMKIQWKELLSQYKGAKIFLGLFVAVIVVYVVGSVLSSPVVNASRYQKLITVEEVNFSDEIQEADFKTIPLLDKSSAELLGNRKMGSLVDMVSQFEVGDDYTQINYQDKPVRVTPLVYASGIKWLTNHNKGIPAYIKIDMATQNTECVKLTEGIRYSKSEYFNHNIYRHLRFHYPTYIFDDQIFFEIDEEGTPYWVCPVKKFTIGLFGGVTVGRAVLCNAITGECQDYPVEKVPSWVDKVYSAERLVGLYNYYGTLKHGFFNSVLGQRDCLVTTGGYNYIAKDDDVWVYTGVTSVSGDESNVGFVLMNQRTKQTQFYKVEGAVESSAMSSAEGQVQNLGYKATFPLLLNISGEPTYFMALKDGAGLVKKYGMVNVQKYQWVAIGDTVSECQKQYVKLLNTNGIKKSDAFGLYETITGKITAIAPVVLEGNTHYYVCVEKSEAIFDINLSDANFATVITYQVGDTITLSYEGYEFDGELTEVVAIGDEK